VVQGQRACNPCRLWKVCCSYESPCQTCLARQHPELCQYDTPLKRVPLNLAPLTVAASSLLQLAPLGAALVSRDDWDGLVGKIGQLELSLQAVRWELARGVVPAAGVGGGGGSNSLEATDEAGALRNVHMVYPLMGETLFLGPNLAPAMAVAVSHLSGGSSAVRDLLDKSILPIFTLENESATYPFVDLWGLAHASPERIENLCSLLPSDAECLQYLRQYRDMAHILFPAIINIQRFETEVTRFLVARTATTEMAALERLLLTDQDVYGKSVHWLGLLFACLASGCQSSSLLRRERQLTS